MTLTRPAQINSGSQPASLDEQARRPANKGDRGDEGAVLCFVGASAVRMFGLTPEQRLIRQFARAGVERVVSAGEADDHGGPVIVVRADAAIDQPLIDYLLSQPNFALLAEGRGQSPIAVHVASGPTAPVIAALTSRVGSPGSSDMPENFRQAAPAELNVTFWSALRKREVPYAMITAPSNQRRIEWRMFMGTYKGATDFITKHLWPWPAYQVVRLIAPLGITPNMVTTIGAAMVVAAFFLFLDGHYGLGLIAAWMMTFLDTVDGKLARLTLTSSKWGDIFDHGIDLIHPPFWYIAWGIGLSAAGTPLSQEVLTWSLALIFGGYVLQRIMEGIAIKVLGLEIHIWRPVDTLFRQITARRNPNLVILTVSAVFGRPDLGLLGVAAWTIICLVLHGIQLAQGLIAARRDGPLVSWMRKPVTTP